MKKNLFGFIGAICGVFPLFLLSTPFFIIQFTDEKIKISIVNLMGILGKKSSSSLGYSLLSTITGSLTGILIIASIIMAIIALIITINGIIENKNVMDKAFMLSSINIVTVVMSYITLKGFADFILSADTGGLDYFPGWGIVVSAILFIAFFVLSFIGYLTKISKTAIKKEKFASLYEYKKLLDENIISQEEFDNYKTELLKKIEEVND